MQVQCGLQQPRRSNAGEVGPLPSSCSGAVRKMALFSDGEINWVDKHGLCNVKLPQSISMSV